MTGERNSGIACVAGDMDLVRAVGLAGIRSVVLAEPGAPPRFSRFCREAWPWPDTWSAPDAALTVLDRVAAVHTDRPVLFFECDADLLLVARHRDRLASRFRFVLADPRLVEDLVDKARFQALAQQLDLPVPRSVVVGAAAPAPDPAALRFPVIVKPVTRRPAWMDGSAGAKAILVERPADLAEACAQVRAHGALIVQELVPGPETAVESYHVYVDADGTIAAEFTGKKIRTYPVRHGDSTALVITDAGDVRRLGRLLTRRLELTGVAKFDFKRGPDGRLWLLEINPRFTLWHHLAAVAGLNVPALVHADLAGGVRPPRGEARAGVAWCRTHKDLRAARASGLSLLDWLRWARACEAHTPFTRDDPWPLLGAVGWRLAVAPATRAWRAGTRTAGVAGRSAL